MSIPDGETRQRDLSPWAPHPGACPTTGSVSGAQRVGVAHPDARLRCGTSARDASRLRVLRSGTERRGQATMGPRTEGQGYLGEVMDLPSWGPYRFTL